MQKTTFSRQIMQFVFLILFVALLAAVLLNELGWFFLLLFLLLLILLLWELFGGQRDGPTSPPPQYPPEELYVQGQLLIRGPEAAVLEAVKAVSSKVILSLGDTEEEQEKNRIRFSGLSDQVRQCFRERYGVDFDNFIIARYSFDDTEAEVAAAIEFINDVVERGSEVRAEPNWLSGHQWETSGFGWEPWEPTGSGEGAGYPANKADFTKQWAFKHIGLENVEDHHCGAGVRIGIFDTWPEDEQNNLVAKDSISWVTQPSRLNISLLTADYELPAEKKAPNLSSHGLFTLGLAHAAAPQAEKWLYRALNKNNKGDLFSLIHAIYDFIRENAPLIAEKELYGAVINLSLGIRVPPAAAKLNLPLEVQALRDILRVARCAKIVVVAAAGNSSACKDQPEPAEIPANWSEIIGVASSNKADGRSCFSNRGNLAAPGGSGRKKDGQDCMCMPSNDDCKNKGPDCEFSVIGPVFQQGPYTDGFAYWSGTSFSTPMVAGLAACVIAKGLGQLSPDQVRRILECGATPSEAALGKGIINVARTLDGFEDCLAQLGIVIERPQYEGQNVKQIAPAAAGGC